jgi:hypothetical protein
MAGDNKVVSFAEFKARRDERQEPRGPESLEPKKALTPEEVAHRFVMLAHLRTQNVLPPSTIH